MFRDDFAVLILTHGRADRVHTYDTLKRQGYSGKTYFIVDDEDSQIDKYIENFGRENVKIFSKEEVAKKIDEMDLERDRRAIIYARVASFDIAKEIGLKYFVQFDDDYTSFGIRYEKTKGELNQLRTKNIDQLFEMTIEFLEKTNALSICWSQGGDHMGGIGGRYKSGLLRKAMNSFFVRSDRPIKFIGRVNEDVNTYTLCGSRGELMLTVTDVMLNQLQTQSNSGGMTEMYLDSGTYIKSFYSVICMPSAVDVRLMGTANRRLHHHVNWNKCVPKILEEGERKNG